MIETWKSFLLERAAGWELPVSQEWTFLFHNNYQPHDSNFVLLWFYRSEPFPRVVAKISRNPQILDREFQNMQAVYADIPALVAKPLHFGLLDGFWTLWMQGIPGWLPESRDLDSPAVVRAVLDLLCAVHSAVRRPKSLFADRHRQMVLEPLEALSQYGSAQAVVEGCRRTREEISETWIQSLPVIPQHGDITYGNLLCNKRRWYLLDWETYGMVDLPLYDFLTFLLSAQGTRETVPEKRGEKPGLVESYCRLFGITPRDTRPLLLLTFANWFHVMWKDGRQEFTQRTYKTIEDYFLHRERWEELLLPRG